MKQHRIWLTLSVFIGLMLPGLSWAQASSNPPQKITVVEGIGEYRFDNGLQLLLVPDRTKPTVTVNATYFVGSRHEGRGEAGMAHLLEHMLFKGSKEFKNVWKELEDHGADFNGTTWLDRTNYFETLPTTEPANFEFALRLEADRMINSLIQKSDLDTEFSVVRNEFESGENDPINILLERMMSASFLWHNYGKSTIGSKSDIERVPIENLRAFYQKFYQPDNAMLVIAGDFEESDALTLVGKYFGTIPRPERKLQETYTIEPVQDGRRHVELRRTGDLGAAGVVYHVSSGVHPDFAPIEVFEKILSDQPSGRLYKALVESGLAATVYGSAWMLKEPGVFQSVATIRKEQTPEPVLAKMREVIEHTKQSPITEEEVQRAKTKILKDFDISFKNSRFVGIILSEFAASGDWKLMLLHRDRIKQVTVADVQRVALYYFKDSNCTSGIFYPTQAQEIDRAQIPETPDVQKSMADYRGAEAIAAGEAFEATPDHIEKRTKRLKLSNNIDLALLPKETRGNAVMATIMLRFGNESNLTGKVATLRLLPEMLMRGTKKHTYQEIRDQLDALKAQVHIGSMGRFAGQEPGRLPISIQTDREHLTDVISLVGELLQEPIFPEKEFEIVKREELAGLEEQRSTPQTLAFISVLRRMNFWPKDNVRYIPTMDEAIEQVKSVDLSSLKELHAQLFGSSFTQITVVGDFDPTAVEQIVEKTFSNWPSPKPYERIDSPFQKDVQGSEEIVQTPDKQMAMIGAGINIQMQDNHPDYPALVMANYVLGASAKSRLLNRLRQKEGLSYGAFSFFEANTQEENALLGAAAICAPQNADKAMNALLDELQRLVNEGIPLQELNEAKDSYALQMQNSLTNDTFVANILNEGLYLKRGFEFQKDLYQKINELTPEQVQSALKRHIDLNRLVRVKAGDLPTPTSGQ